MVLLGLALALQSGVLSDARLTKPTDFDVSLRQITDFCAEVSSSSGVKFSVAKDIQDLKVDVFVNKRPLGETLDKVAKVLDAQWMPFEKGYRLERDIPTANREKNFVKAAEDLQLSDLKLKLWACQYVASKLPYNNEPGPTRPIFVEPSVRDKITKEWDDELRAAEQAHDETRIVEGIRRRDALSFGLRSYSLGRVLLQLNKEDVDRFWKGAAFAASTIPEVKLRLYQSDFLQSIQTKRTGPEGKNVPIEYEHRRFTFFRFNPSNGKFRANELSFYFEPSNPALSVGGSQSGGMFSGTKSYLNVDPSLKKMAFYTQLQPWMKPYETPLKFPQTIEQNTPVWDSPWAGKQFRLGDHLRWLHQATSIPIVAQADRSILNAFVPGNGVAPLNNGEKLASQAVGKLMGDSQCLAKEDNGYLLARNFAYWSRRKSETPEATWSKVEPRETGQLPTLDQALFVARAFREDQLAIGETNYPATRAKLPKVTECLDSLKLFAMLSPRQREIAARDEGLGFSDLVGNQQDQLLNSALKLILEHYGCTYELAKSLALNGFGLEQLKDLRFTAKWKDRVSNNAFVDTPTGKKLIEKPTAEESQRQTLWFTFSLSRQEGLTQYIDLKK
ncbi:MAG: hypothetical protein WCI55_01690 [Armatimonadota bacterium]